MAPRVYVSRKRRTYAPGERDEIKENRYWVTIELLSLDVEKKHDIGGKTGEFYFEAGSRLHKIRMPVRGTINLEENETFMPRQKGFTLWNEFVETDTPKTIEIPLKLKEADIGKDKTLINEKIDVQLGVTGQNRVLRGEGVKVKIRVSAPKTRY